MKNDKELDIRTVPGVTSKMVREYKKLCRRERYLKEQDQCNGNVHFGYEDEIHFLLPDTNSSEDSDYEEDIVLRMKLAEALAELKVKNKSWYDAVVAYYYSDEKTTYDSIAKNMGLGKQTVYDKVKFGIGFLRNKLIDE